MLTKDFIKAVEELDYKVDNEWPISLKQNLTLL